MAILAQCPICRARRTVKAKKCKCGEDLDKAKRAGRVRYWIQYRLPDGRQRKEFVGTLIKDAIAADGKRKTQKKEGRIFDMLPESRVTFSELAEWYLNLERVKALASYGTIKINIGKFNKVFGDTMVSDVKPADLENYQAKRLKEGIAPATVDHEIGKTKTMIIKAFDNDMVSGNVLKTFKRVKKTLKPGSDVRDRVLSHEEFERLLSHAEGHLMGILMMGYYTGMRRGEIMGLTWDRVDLQKRVIRLEAKHTKDREARNVPICDELYRVLREMPNRIQQAGGSNRVFQYKGQGIKGDIRDSLKQACKKAGISYGRFTKGGFIFHDLRHTFCTNLRKAGVPESVIMEITGHSTREMFDRYNRVDDEDTKKAVDQLQGYFANVTQTVTHERLKIDSNEKESAESVDG
ncbi:MAG: site-specific integrase [Deltaproteobacteria bacterium]|nr:site-specific integrase [Deltaproteobacteria bacterium]